MSETKYLIVRNLADGGYLATLLDDGWTLVISWVAGDSIHHIVSKNE